MSIANIKNPASVFAVPVISVKTVSDSKYAAKIVETDGEFESVLRLRRDVFRNELAGTVNPDLFSDLDEYDAKCLHLIVTEKVTGSAVGTYRLNPFENAGSMEGFYAAGEFCLEDLPPEMLRNSVELGRACIAKDHRNSRVLFLLWRLLASYMQANDIRYLFGCCSVFTQDPRVAANVLARLRNDGHVHESLKVRPRPEKAIVPKGFIADGENAEIPPLVNIYMRIGAKVCGEPAIDRDFKTVDYFVLFDLDEINRKYKEMFFGK